MRLDDLRPDITTDEAVEALRDEVRRLRELYGADLGWPYLAWRRRLDDLMGHTPERDVAHARLLDIYEGAAP
jgi:hypothetical protein